MNLQYAQIILTSMAIIVIPTFLWAFKSSIFDRLDRLEKTLERNETNNAEAHKNMWEEINKTREKLAIVSTTQDIQSKIKEV